MFSRSWPTAVVLAIWMGGRASSGIADPVAGFHFLFDDEWVDRTVGVRRELAQPLKDPEPIMNSRAAWEGNSRALLGLIFDKEEEKFKMWYRSENDPAEGEAARQPRFVCYAESRNGRDWRRPELGLVEFGGTKRNNILAEIGEIDTSFFSILKDPADPNPLRRYKAAGFDRTPRSLLRDKPSGGAGFTVNFSADGLHWPKEPLLVMDTSDVTDADMLLPGRDPIRGKWVVFMRPRTKPKRRFIGYSESADFEHWTYPRMLITPDAQDSEFLEFYGLAACRVAGGYIGGVWAFYNHPAWSPMSNELVYSSDGLHYRRTRPGRAWIPAGPRGSFDSTMLMPKVILDRGDEIWIYYDGSNASHGSDRTPGSRMTNSVTQAHEPRRNGIGLARLPWGQFAGYRTDHEGMVETKWLTNYGVGAAVAGIAAIDRGGEIQAEILDQYGDVIPGWSRAESRYRLEPSNHDQLAFYWGGTNLVGRAGQRSAQGGSIGHVVKLRFYLRQAALYGFQLDSEPGTPAYLR